MIMPPIIATVQAPLRGFEDIPPVVTIDRGPIPAHVRAPLAFALSLGGRGTVRDRVLVAAWRCFVRRGSVPRDAMLGSLAGCSEADVERYADELAAERDGEGRRAMSLWPVLRAAQKCPTPARILAAMAAERRKHREAMVKSTVKVRCRPGRLAMRERGMGAVMVRKGEGAEAGT